MPRTRGFVPFDEKQVGVPCFTTVAPSKCRLRS